MIILYLSARLEYLCFIKSEYDIDDDILALDGLNKYDIEILVEDEYG